MKLQPVKDKLSIYLETRKRKIFVGLLIWNEAENYFEFTYDKKYIRMRMAVPLGQEFPLNRIKHKSRDKLFPTLADRIPSRHNPAYEEYCNQMGISPKETNPIILLGSIGKRGPSSFVFEPVYQEGPNIVSELVLTMSRYRLTYDDLAKGLQMNRVTLLRITKMKSHDRANLALLRIFLSIPEALEQQIQITAKDLPLSSIKKFNNLIEDMKEAKKQRRSNTSV